MGLTAKAVICKEYGNSKNFMTPEILETGWIIENELAYEFSEGEGIDRETIYGLSIVRLNPDGSTKRETKLSKCFHNKNEVGWYIESLRGQ